jgi:hypothetical protein
MTRESGADPAFVSSATPPPSSREGVSTEGFNRGERTCVAPVSITVDRVFELLNDALLYAIEKGGNKAKSVAWDTKHHFLVEIGDWRSSAILKQSPTPSPPITEKDER